jgi:multiple sugar transport system ATP-binding protein
LAEISLRNVSKSFGAVIVFDDVSLTVGDSEFVVFLGPSGSGKSTLLRMIAGLEATDRGEIWIGGRRVDGLPPGQREVAMVFQNYALYPHMNVRDNLAFGLRNVGTGGGEIDRRVREAARILEIGQLLDRRPSQLSGGQRQRVAIGRAIVKDPKAFLFDEPLANLDAALRVRTRVELAELHQRMAATMIYVTHDQTEAMTLADRIVVLNDRRIEQIGSPMEVYSRPASRFVAGFVGSPAMNFLDVTREPDAMTFRLGDGTRLETAIDAPADRFTDGATLGIRPEAVRITGDTGTTAGAATVVEQLGERTLVHVRLGDGSVLVAQDAGNSRVRAGDQVRLAFDATAAHLFDRAGQAWHADAHR